MRHLLSVGSLVVVIVTGALLLTAGLVGAWYAWRTAKFHERRAQEAAKLLRSSRIKGEDYVTGNIES